MKDQHRVKCRSAPIVTQRASLVFAKSRVPSQKILPASVTIPLLQPILSDDMEAVDGVLREALHSDVPLIQQVAEYIIAGGGKRLRPALLLLTAQACGYRGTHHHTLAAVVEMIHTATLLHDDVVDESSLRRGHATANAMFGNAASVLVGDFLYSRAFQLMVTTGSVKVLKIFSDATNVIAEGEVLQLLNSGDPDVDEQQYLAVIRRKTATLFEAAARLGAVLGHAGSELEDALARYGMHLGTAFQLIDDVLDYTGDHAAMGKNPGDDLAAGKPTLPLIRALEKGTAQEVAFLRGALAERNLGEFAAVLSILHRTGALDHARACAETESTLAAECLTTLSPTTYREVLLELSAFAVVRSF